MMAIMFFLIPVMVVTNGTTYRGPSYLRWRMNPEGLNVQWSCKDYGKVDNVMICAVNAEQDDLDWLSAQADVYAFGDLGMTVGALERAEMTDYLEATEIPADWLSPVDTYRTAARTITGMFLYMQRLSSILGESPFDLGAELNTQYRNLPSDVQDAIMQAAVELGYSTEPIRDNWTMRVILKHMSDEWGDAPIYFGFVTL